MACHELANRSPKCASATSAYRAGYEGRQMGQGASLATTADPLAQRQNDRRPTSDGKCWQENFRGGRRNLGHTGKEGNGSEHPTAKGISTSAAPACLHPEVKRQDASSRSVSENSSLLLLNSLEKECKCVRIIWSHGKTIPNLPSRTRFAFTSEPARMVAG